MAPRSRGIPVTSRRGVQLAVLVLAGILVWSAYLLATTGMQWLFPGCREPAGPIIASYMDAAWRVVIAAGLVGVALKDVRGPTLQDPFLIGLVLLLGSLLALTRAGSSIAEGIVRLGRPGCLVINPPLSYGVSIVMVLIGGLLLYAAAVTVLSRRS